MGWMADVHEISILYCHRNVVECCFQCGYQFANHDSKIETNLLEIYTHTHTRIHTTHSDC